jgi:hypothetical protein
VVKSSSKQYLIDSLFQSKIEEHIGGAKQTATAKRRRGKKNLPRGAARCAAADSNPSRSLRRRRSLSSFWAKSEPRSGTLAIFPQPTRRGTKREVPLMNMKLLALPLSMVRGRNGSKLVCVGLSFSSTSFAVFLFNEAWKKGG